MIARSGKPMAGRLFIQNFNKCPPGIFAWRTWNDDVSIKNSDMKTPATHKSVNQR
jgi:hypothetical protein